MRINKDTTPIHIPRAMVALGDFKRFSREVIQSIKELRDRKDTIIGVIRKSSIFVAPLQVYGLRKDGEVWKVKVKPGYVIISNPSASSPPLKYIMPKIGELELDNAEETPELEVSAGQTVYIKLPTNTDDQSTTGPLIVADEPEKEGTHYQPPPNAVSGEYYYRLADITTDPDSEAEPPPLIISKKWFSGPLIHRPIIPEMKSVGSAALAPGSPAIPGDPEDPESEDIPAVDPEEDDNKGGTPVFKTRSNSGDFFEFRSLKQMPGQGVPCIKKLKDEVPAPEDEEGNPILDGEGNPIPGEPAEEQGDTIRFCRFDVESGPPVTFENEGGEGAINFLKFSGFDGSYNDGAGGVATFIKGICTAATNPSGGGNFDIKLFGFTYNITGGGSPVLTLEGDSDPYETIFVRGGRMFRTSAPAGSAASTGTYNLYIKPHALGSVSGILNPWVAAG